jgi:hypothetical protein
VFERANISHALDRAFTVIDQYCVLRQIWGCENCTAIVVVFRVFSAIQEYDLKLVVGIQYHSVFVIDGKFSLVRMKQANRSVN